MHQKPLGGRAPPADPLGSLSAPPDSLAAVKGLEPPGEKGERGKERGRG